MRIGLMGLLFTALSVATPAIADVPNSDEAEAERANRLAQQEAARAATWNTYYEDIRRDLRTRTDARSRALATTWPYPPGDDDNHRKMLAALAPDDPLVQWMVAIRSFPRADALAATAIDRLKRIEPDNAAVWELAFELAMQHDDAGAAEIAFDRMTASTRSDEHYVDFIHIWMAIFESHPPPAMLFDSPAEAAASPLTLATGYAAPMRLPAYTPLLTYCGATSAGSDRARRCAEIGHLMADHGTSLGCRNIGLGLIGNIKQVDREIYWIEMHLPAASGLDPKDLSRVQAYVTDWRELDDQHLIVERALRRAGIPMSPPPGWEIPPLTTTLL